MSIIHILIMFLVLRAISLVSLYLKSKVRGKKFSRSATIAVTVVMAIVSFVTTLYLNCTLIEIAIAITFDTLFTYLGNRKPKENIA